VSSKRIHKAGRWKRKATEKKWITSGAGGEQCLDLWSASSLLAAYRVKKEDLLRKCQRVSSEKSEHHVNFPLKGDSQHGFGVYEGKPYSPTGRIQTLNPADYMAWNAVHRAQEKGK